SAEQLKHAISHAKILIGNDYEVALMEKKLGCSHVELLKIIPVLITTLGGKGSRIETKTDTIEIAVAKVSSVVDPTGAGDAYRAGFLAGYLRGKDLKTSGQMGSLAAAYAVENYGTITHLYTQDQFQKRYVQNFKEQVSL
ncbi:MAG: PfkB family carbohydrate kinase, partial [Patescibacteria group bacterium]